MKKLALILALALSITSLSFAEGNERGGNNLYTFFVNIVNEQFNFPLIGFINIAKGDHNLPQIGFVNWNLRNFGSAQLGFINTIAGNLSGFQLGYVNTSLGKTNGAQMGFVNTTLGNTNGAQIGFINTTLNSVNGVQFGFVNFADTIESGIPIGFLSVVRNGGYRALEFGVSEIALFNVSFKIGVERFYSSFTVSYNPFLDIFREQLIFGFGFGSIITLTEVFFLNPEVKWHNRAVASSSSYLSVTPYFGFNIIPRLSVVLGPTVSLEHNRNNDERFPFFRIVEHSINRSNKLYLGARVGIRFRW